MNRRKKIIIAIIIVILIGLITIIAGVLFINTGGNLASGNGNILVCAIDESEPRPGMGTKWRNKKLYCGLSSWNDTSKCI